MKNAKAYWHYTDFNMKYDAVLEGGGAKIGGLIGALTGIEMQGFEPANLAGTSSGAIVASLRMAGYEPEELRSILLRTNFENFLDGSRLGSIYKLMSAKGLYDGDVFYKWIKEKLDQKGIRTFGDLRDTSETNPKYKWKLKVIAADITDGRMLTLPDDIVFYDIEPDELEVAYAVRMSMSIPYYFKPIILKGNYIVDGGLLSNFPIWLFDSDGTPEHPTFGLILNEDSANERFEIDGLVSYVTAMIKTMLRVNDRKFVRPEDYKFRTILIPSGNIKTTEFDLTASNKEWLYHSGLKAALEFFIGWSMDDYVEWANKIRGVRNDSTGRL